MTSPKTANGFERLKAAAERAAEWFSGFGYNRYGIACTDDFPDHEPIARELRAALDECAKRETLPKTPLPDEEAILAEALNHPDPYDVF
ncbi:MAG TPA: hypothetical protein PK082_01655 [Phycisphaerae bacterium]|nr:hypothetical protein [Phycisphaerae bacterium]